MYVEIKDVDDITKLATIRQKIISSVADATAKRTQFGGIDSTAPVGFNEGHNLYIQKYASSALEPSINLSGCYIGLEIVDAAIAALKVKQLAVEAKMYALGVRSIPVVIPVEAGAAAFRDMSQLHYVQSASGGITNQYTYTTSSPGVATIDATTGVLTFVSVGNTTVTATEKDTTNSDTYVFTLYPALNVGNSVSYQLDSTPKTNYISGGSGTFTYSSSVQTVASITNAGVLTIVGIGSTIIQVVDTKTTKVRSFSITVYSNLVLNSPNFVFMGSTATITTTGGSSVIVKTSDTNSNFVGDVLTPVSVGTTTISVSDSITGKILTKVLNVYDRMVVPTTAFVSMGNNGTYTATKGSGTYTYASSDTDKFTVSDTGVITPVAEGIASLTVTDTVTSEVRILSITVYATMVVSPTSLNITNGSTSQLTVTKGSGNFTYSSDTTTVATVSATGLVTALIAGSAIITITDTTTNLTQTVNVTVN